MKQTKMHFKKRRRRRRGDNRLPLLIICVALALTAVVLLLMAFGNWLDASNDISSSIAVSSSNSLPKSQEPQSQSVSVSKPESSISSSLPNLEVEIVKDEYYEEAEPIVANRFQKIPEDYKVSLVNVGNYQLEERTAKAYNDMQKAAEKDGISLWIVSAYRSYKHQVTNYNNTKQRHINNGLSEEDAIIETEKYIAVPGSSEHGLGTTVDLNSLYIVFNESKEYEWLKNNSWKFGFIERYPQDKEDITHISYEPWHYRYVGSNHAKIIVDNNFCLEEYGENLKKN
ncbi:MAG: M15 family metallopeptidase [Christensenella sp.]